MFQGVIPGTTIPSFVTELSNRRVCGTLQCKFETFNKSINIWHGSVISASSTLIDDRLGEIIYREGKLTLDNFVDAAGKVTKEMRFGDLLIKRGIFTETDLWHALNSQSRAIINSLCFYKEVDVRFEEHQNSPKMETLVQFEIDRIFREALDELKIVEQFESCARAQSRLELSADAERLATSDFQRDMVSLVTESSDFNVIVDSTSRLSSIYTLRALHQLFLQGIIVDTWGLTEAALPEHGKRALRQVVEDANFMFAELANAAKIEQITGWNLIVTRAADILAKQMGDGVFLNADSGFIFDSILRASVMQGVIRTRAQEHFQRVWPIGFVKCVEEALYATVLFILFELYNRKFGSKEFARVKAMIDAMRDPNRAAP